MAVSTEPRTGVPAAGPSLRARQLPGYALPGFAVDAHWSVWLGPHAPADAVSRLRHAGLVIDSERTLAERNAELARQGPALALLAQGAAGAAAAAVGFGVAVLFVADHFVRPALIGGATRLPFLLVLLGILGGVEAFGLLGLFAGPAIMAALTLLWREWTAATPDGT